MNISLINILKIEAWIHLIVDFFACFFADLILYIENAASESLFPSFLLILIVEDYFQDN